MYLKHIYSYLIRVHGKIGKKVVEMKKSLLKKDKNQESKKSCRMIRNDCTNIGKIKKPQLYKIEKLRNSKWK